MEKNVFVRRIQEDLKSAVKARDKAKTSTFRMLIAELKNAELKDREELTVEQEIAILGSYARKCRESLVEFEKAGRDELVKESEAELEIVKVYLPKQMDEGEIRKEISVIIEESGASGPRDMGRVMGMMMKKFKGKVDGGLVKKFVEEILKSD
ncbi:MAG: GatB/YqeY domain-containing protein [Candidatus Krumholzibacteria bacterium]|nr:GatB/YqeY domain-containing protein [Candidatus Krumholzibacteria bacterium]